MRQRPSSTSISLVLAVVVTTLSVGLGVLLAPTGIDAPIDLAASSTSARARGQAATPTRIPAPAGPRSVVIGGSASPSPSGAPVSPDPATNASVSPAPSVSASADAAVAPSTVASTAPAPATVGAATLPPYKVRRSDVVLREQPPGPVPGDPFSFQIGTLNILGSQHRGNGTGRAAALAGAILGRGVDLVGMQEVQDDQLAVLDSRLTGYTVWPGQALGNQGVRLQIAFRDALFELVDAGSITTVFDHQQRPIPWVKLRERATGGEFYVVDIHNSPGGQSADRYSATTQEIGLVRQLQASGDAVFLMGDTNEHTFTACRIAAATGMVGSNGLSSDGACNAGAGPIKIDHILGSGSVEFSGHVVDYDAPVAASTDHAFVHAAVTVTPLVAPANAADLD